ncbi:MAG: 2-iminoacetate synthase ThiH [Candidatus Omnitrophica bacterium]|nr:2-iminoacetate synthase ThiH [Candidatus Omnitrophota bacterium]
MSYYDTLLKYKALSFEKIFRDLSPEEVERAIHSDAQDPERLLALLSPAAEELLEPMAQKAHALTLQHFGKTIQLYTPMYLSNYCENQCVYCGFNAANEMPRKKLTLGEVEKEAAFIASTGVKHLLILTGDSREKSPPAYIKECLQVLMKYFSSISAEIYALTEEEYTDLARSGIDGLTLYQETYDETVYARVHKSGPKKNFRFRLDAPEHAAKSGMRSVNVGTLLGLNDWRKEVFWMGLHAQYLQDRYGEVEIGASLPRLRPHAGDFNDIKEVSDRHIAQTLMALRLFLPRLGIALSTRESAALRENLLPLGITRMSAGSTTRVGGHTVGSPEEKNMPQFEISDPRDVEEVKEMLAGKGYQPVLKDWMQI